MNKTININLGGFFFHIDEIAFQKLFLESGAYIACCITNHQRTVNLMSTKESIEANQRAPTLNKYKHWVSIPTLPFQNFGHPLPLAKRKKV